MPDSLAAAMSFALDPLAVHEQDALATIMAEGALLICALRVLRCYWMLRGWPSRLSLILRGGNLAALTAQIFRTDHENFLLFEKNEGGFAGVKEIADRSVFKLAAVTQDLCLLQERNWVADEAFCDHLRNCLRRVAGSQIVEDAFNRQKNSRR